MKTNHPFLRLIGAMLALMMLMFSLAACGKGNGDSTNTDDSSVSTTTTTMEDMTTTVAPEPGSPVATEGEPIELTADFVLVCSDNQSDSMLMLANTLKSKIKAKTGITLSMGHIGSPKEKEIVLGYLEDRTACKPAYDTITASDYTVYTADHTLVLGAWTNDNLAAAADLFVEQALVQEGDKWMIYPYRVSYGSTGTAGVELSQYRIVYSASASSYLTKTVVPYLQQQLQETFGVSLTAVTDAEAPVDYEIMLGSTNRDTDLTRAYLSDGENALSYYGHALVTEGTRIYLIARADIALYSAAANLCEQAIPEVGPSTFCMSAEPWISPAADTEDVAELAEGADIRVMSYNILHPSWSNVVSNVPVEGRDTRVANIVLYYMPDVIGIQETNANWHNNLQKLLVETGIYAKACEKNNAKSYNMTTFLYNTQTVKLVEEYVLDLDKNSDIRVFSVAVFEKISDGTRFVVTNTHPAPTGQAENYARNFADLMTLAKAELEKYKDLSVIMTGDFNTKEQSAMYQTFMDTAGVKDAKYEADVLVRDYCTFSGWPNVAPKSGNANCIDHIFVNANTDVKLFNVVIDHEVELTSDHIPIYADIELK